jgi:GT2 family glycosyltransferase
MKLSVVMLMYNINEQLAQLTKTAIDSVNFSVKDKEFIMIDNNSSYGAAYAKAETDIYVHNKINTGYTGGVNQGLALAKGDFIAIANNDIKITPNWWEEAQKIFDEDPEVGTVHFKMVGYDEPPNLGTDTWITGKERWCHASFYIIRREAIPEGNYFEGYTAGGYDDYDFFHRMRDLNGWKQAYTNKAAFQHMDSSTYNALDAIDHSRSERDLKNREIYKERHGEYPDIQFAQLFPEQMITYWKPFP